MKQTAQCFYYIKTEALNDLPYDAFHTGLRQSLIVRLDDPLEQVISQHFKHHTHILEMKSQGLKTLEFWKVLNVTKVKAELEFINDPMHVKLWRLCHLRDIILDHLNSRMERTELIWNHFFSQSRIRVPLTPEILKSSKSCTTFSLLGSPGSVFLT